MSDQNLHIVLLRMLECIQQIELYIKGMSQKKFFEDRKTQDACVMQLQVIGELCGNIRKNSPEFNAIPYQKIIGLRNIIAHDYFGIDKLEIWIIVTQKINALKVTIDKYLQKI